jgi:hypothetical protein
LNFAAVEPGRRGLRADEKKYVADRLFNFFAGRVVAPMNAL